MLFWYKFIYSNQEQLLVDHVLMGWSAYYQALDKVSKKKFVLRCIHFYHSINWDSHSTFKLSRQAIIIISSAFTQITFGLRKHTLKDFDTILIMPRSYSYIKNDLMFNGDVNLSQGRITLAWPAVKKGFLIPDDSMNLCIHEFAHCLMLENRVSIFHYFFKYSSWLAYKKEAAIKIEKIRSGKNRFLRNYGGTNEMEFFAVAMESFFEEPDEFLNLEPSLYNSLVQLLNQDPSILQ